MKILGLDTSCDDTCIALLEIKSKKIKILSNIVSSQVKIHAKYGGVYPFLAKREHQRNLPTVFKKALRFASLTQRKIDLIGVTVGPGLEPCLWQGVNFAKKIAKECRKPLIPVNHIEAHILANFLNLKPGIPGLKSIFPAVCLIVSGGHTQLILMEDIGRYELIGETRDDAAGECFDKTARILGLGYPGGPAIAAEVVKLKSKTSNFKSKIKLPRPMMFTKDYDFSFSGLKTAVLYEFKKQSPRTRKAKIYIRTMCTEIQQAIIDVLLCKTIKAAKNCKVKSIILGGGVAANEELRKQFRERIKKETPDCKFYIPDPHFCTDNAAMTAVAAYFHRNKKTNSRRLRANANPAVKI